MPVPRRTRVREWLHDAAAAARRAAQRALRSKTASRTVQIGASGVSSAEFDVRTEAAIVDFLESAPVPLNLVSEELGELPRGADWTLVVDPVDGSRNASRNIPFYCVSLAVARRDLAGVEMGIIQEIPSGRVYFAERGHGAMYEGRRIRPRAYDPNELLIGAAIDYEHSQRLRGTPHAHFRDFGSAALEMCMVADGRLDAFVSQKPLLRIIDIAASTLILKEAGGHVWDLNRKPLNVKFEVRHRFGMVAAATPRIWKVLR